MQVAFGLWQERRTGGSRDVGGRDLKMTLWEEQAKCSKTKYGWVKTVLGHARSLRLEKQAVGVRGYRLTGRCGVAVVDDVGSYLACRPS